MLTNFLKNSKWLYGMLFILVTGLILFAVVKLSIIEQGYTPIKIYSPRGTLGEGLTASVIGSKTGMKYYFPWCGELKRIKPKNQIVFSSAEEALALGYSPAGNCKGLK